MTETPAPTPVGQISADGQFRWDGAQWAPIPAGEREPTSWTRPMQQASAALFVVSAIATPAVTFIFVNRNSMLKSLQAQGTQIPAGTDVNSLLEFTVTVSYAVAIFLALLYLVGAVGSFIGWRWMFWAALIVFGIGGIGTFTNLGTIFKPQTSPVPISALVVGEVFSVLDLAMCVWMLVAAVKFGPWAMQKPRAS